MEIAVLGGGNGALAAATDLTEQGHRVRLWRRDAGSLNRFVNLKDHEGARPVTIAAASGEIGEAIKDH